MKTPYKERSDLEKVQSQWHKLTGLHGLDEWSAAVVRAATAAELAANFAVRAEFASRSKFNKVFVDTLLYWANGLAGKTDRLLVPLSVGSERHKTIKELRTISKDINAKRNAIAHQGEFCKAHEAKALIQQARTFIETLVRMYDAEFELKDQKT